jgi:hypothetical protein
MNRNRTIILAGAAIVMAGGAFAYMRAKAGAMGVVPSAGLGLPDVYNTDLATLPAQYAVTIWQPQASVQPGAQDNLVNSGPTGSGAGYVPLFGFIGYGDYAGAPGFG